MTTRLRPVGTLRATAELWRGLAWLAAGVVAIVAAAPSRAQMVLPAPMADPRAIDFGADPVLKFIGNGAAGEDFIAAVATAVARHPAQAEASAMTDAARAQRREARAALFPTLSASVVGSQSLARDFADTSAAVERLLPRGRTDASLGADQLLFDFGASGGRIAGASARLRAAAADAKRSAASTTLAAVTVWYQVMAFQALTELSDALVARHRTILADTGARVAAGVGAGGDITRAEAGLADAVGAATTSARSLATARARFREVFGAEAPRHPPRPPLDDATLASVDAAIAASRSTPEVAAAEAVADAAHAEARAVRGDALPRLSAGVTGTRFNIFNAGPNYDVRGQVVLRQSLSTGGAEAARSSAAKARARAADASVDRARIEAERDAEAGFADAAILDAALAARSDAYRANRRNRDVMAEQFRLSRGNLIDLLRTEADYFAAARALVEGSVERDVARYTLLARTGGLLRHFAITLGN
jgi:outer membrane protein, adhesin transport system